MGSKLEVVHVCSTFVACFVLVRQVLGTCFGDKLHIGGTVNLEKHKPIYIIWFPQTLLIRNT